MYQSIIFEKTEGIAWIKLNRPAKLNAFTLEMQKEIHSALIKCKNDDEVRAIIITGEGRGFCSGQDLSSFGKSVNLGNFLREYYNPMIEEMASLEKPIIAAINGVAAGAGLSLALACDFRIICEDATLVNAFIHIGLVPDAGNMYYLPRLVGYAKALELAVLGEKITAHEALKSGLATKVVARDHWEEEVLQFANRLANLPTRAIGLIKKYMRESFESDLQTMLEYEARAQAEAGETDDHKEGVMAFLEKRSPKFSGK